MDLDAWINDPPSESEDESTPSNSSYDNRGLFYGDNENNSNTSYDGYQKTKNYTEPTPEELEQQRQTRRQTEKMNPFYLKDTKKPKPIQKV